MDNTDNISYTITDNNVSNKKTDNNNLKFLVYILKNNCKDGYAWVVKKHIPYDIDKTVKVDGDFNTTVLKKYYFSNNGFYICIGNKEFLNKRLINEYEFNNMKKSIITKCANGLYEFELF